MHTIPKEEVARIAGLARLALTDEEIERMTGEFDVIANAIDRVSEIATSDVPATSHPIPLTNVMREDEVKECIDRESVLACAPESENGRFLVPQILGEE
ncbi:Asp-tRNA(Asn)/Glu-tRNA(Gln) amidotransferase subunit GatC [Actinomyces sp. zg-332]|uniref:Asp-tRNA(Asn)/Glu-tRNA(Gln) amidotransferase subunit GatC n=1 Tax=Actinomyces sp. zg-332 TaxID=2708340 RepID=UPI00141FECBB|nr:Asp-tRNA(Asn)/Glu-tRNA(Gln) amidotransferase subunit GatC [Actinomyces sp. zg-332]QPK93907.1 Asp-tRNA(Asn)/Glu-tRNA(Gln) amidotransferase subunit GatC [Actinomyces sp. zg-332]